MGICCELEPHIIYGVIAIVVAIIGILCVVDWDNYRK